MRSLKLLATMLILAAGVCFSNDSQGVDLPDLKPIAFDPGEVATAKGKKCKKIDVNCTCTGGAVTGTFGATGVRVEDVTGEECSGFFEIYYELRTRAEELCSDGTFDYTFTDMDMGDCTIDWECAKKCT